MLYFPTIYLRNVLTAWKRRPVRLPVLGSCRRVEESDVCSWSRVQGHTCSLAVISASDLGERGRQK